MKHLKLLTISLAAMVAALFFIHAPASAQPDEAPAADTAAPVATPATPAEPAVVPDAVAEDPAKADKEVTAEDLAKQAQKIQENWETLGWMGGTVGIIGFLLLLLRFRPINDLLEERNLKQYKPYVAAGLGVLLGFLQTFITGKGWGPSIVAGLIAGIATPGLHLLFTKGNTK